MVGLLCLLIIRIKYYGSWYIKELKYNNIIIKISSKLTTKPQQTADKFHAFINNTIRDLKQKKHPIKRKDSLHDNITYDQYSVLLSPVTNTDKCVNNRLKGSLSDVWSIDIEY